MKNKFLGKLCKGPLQIFLLELIVIGLALIASEHFWVPKLDEKILDRQYPDLKPAIHQYFIDNK